MDISFSGFDLKMVMEYFPTIVVMITIVFYILISYLKYKMKDNCIVLRESFVSVQKVNEDILELFKIHEDVDMRLLIEMYEVETRKYCGFKPQPQKIVVLRDIQEDLRRILKEIVKSKEHYNLKDKILSFIEDAENRIISLLEKKPFDDLGDPEKSLFIDILEELPKDKAMPKQKLLQIAEIIKNKYQNIEKLQVENQKSAAWTRWGAFGTLIFGILSLILSFYSGFK